MDEINRLKREVAEEFMRRGGKGTREILVITTWHRLTLAEIRRRGLE